MYACMTVLLSILFMESRITLLDKVCGEYEINLARYNTANIHLWHIMVMLWISSVQRYWTEYIG